MDFSAPRAPGRAPNLEVLSLSAMSWPGLTRPSTHPPLLLDARLKAGHDGKIYDQPPAVSILEFKVKMRFSAAERRMDFSAQHAPGRKRPTKPPSCFGMIASRSFQHERCVIVRRSASRQRCRRKLQDHFGFRRRIGLPYRRGLFLAPRSR